MEQMEEVWQEVFLLEADGKLDEAAHHQNQKMEEVKKNYDANKMAYEAALGGGTREDD